MFTSLSIMPAPTASSVMAAKAIISKRSQPVVRFADCAIAAAPIAEVALLPKSGASPSLNRLPGTHASNEIAAANPRVRPHPNRLNARRKKRD
jgi:hypothetical protein